MSFDLTGRRALVTGASRGIGREIALAYARAGADVAVLARNAELLEVVAGEVRALGRRAVIATAESAGLRLIERRQMADWMGLVFDRA